MDDSIFIFTSVASYILSVGCCPVCGPIHSCLLLNILWSKTNNRRIFSKIKNSIFDYGLFSFYTCLESFVNETVHLLQYQLSLTTTHPEQLLKFHRTSSVIGSIFSWLHLPFRWCLKASCKQGIKQCKIRWEFQMKLAF